MLQTFHEPCITNDNICQFRNCKQGMQSLNLSDLLPLLAVGKYFFSLNNLHAQDKYQALRKI